MRRWKWFQRPDEPLDVVERCAHQPVACNPPEPSEKPEEATKKRQALSDATRKTVGTMHEEIRPEPPFLVIMAGFVVDFHHREACSKCRPDGSCPRLRQAAIRLRAWRDRKDKPS